MLPTPNTLRASLKICKHKNYIYFSIPKVASTNILSILNKAESFKLTTNNLFYSPHNLITSFFSNSIQDFSELIEKSFKFTLVRNPYTRAISAYINKIAQYDPNITPHFEKKYNTRHHKVSFNDFLYIISQDNPNELDPHWRPQTQLTLIDFIKPDFIGHIEYFHDDLKKIIEKIYSKDQIQIPVKKDHLKENTKKINSFFNKKTFEIVQKIYHNDFKNFGYYFDHNRLLPASITIPEPSKTKLFNEYIKSLVLIEKKEYSNAIIKIEHIQKKNTLYPSDHTIFHMIKAFALNMDGKIAKSLEETEKALKIQTEEIPSELHLLKGQLLKKNNALKESIQSFHKAILNNTTCFSAYIELYQHFNSMKHYDEALSVLQEALKFAPIAKKYEIHHYLGEIWKEKGFHQKAKYHFNQSDTKNPFKSIKEIPSGKVCIYGTGAAGMDYFSYITENRLDIDIIAFVNSFDRGNFKGKPLIHINDLTSYSNKYEHLLICSIYYEEITNALKSRKIYNFIIMRNPIFDYNLKKLV
ncbi:MAG: sulfotransferase family 2 domain-containing protein [Desulfamplus sp.]|nr:sulfotransferase family 2 domain-containing protein [Desulfamplus sp.]